jgi:uncharacterized protein YydD (DUF2326 family)
MIQQLSSNLPSFKTVTFKKGLNVLLAEKSEGATDRQSRNGAGKTSFVELVHFLCGADVRQNSIFRSEALKNWTFVFTFEIDGKVVSAARQGVKPSRLFINEGAQPFEMLNEKWKAILGVRWFGLPQTLDDVVEAERFHPSFRSLFSYFARRQFNGGFQSPMQHTIQQMPWDQQVSISYLLGLDWTIPSKLQELRGQEKISQELRKAAQGGEFSRFFGKAADLRTRLTVAQARSERLRKQLDSFQVVPEYKELEREANEVTREIDGLNVENVIDGDFLQQLRASLEEEDAPALGDISKLYDEAGIVLSDMVLRRFSEVALLCHAVGITAFLTGNWSV